MGKAIKAIPAGFKKSPSIKASQVPAPQAIPENLPGDETWLLRAIHKRLGYQKTNVTGPLTPRSKNKKQTLG